ncbi:hypothetical protein PG984_009052 [Apiospora sp. TS-2023a]
MSSVINNPVLILAVATAKRCTNCDGLYFEQDGSNFVILNHDTEETIAAILVESQVPRYMDLDSQYVNTHKEEVAQPISDTLHQHGLNTIPPGFLGPGPGPGPSLAGGLVSSPPRQPEIVWDLLLRSVEKQRRAHDGCRARAKDDDHELDLGNWETYYRTACILRSLRTSFTSHLAGSPKPGTTQQVQPVAVPPTRLLRQIRRTLIPSKSSSERVLIKGSSI